MITAIDLKDNSEKNVESIKNFDFSNYWLDIFNPDDEELTILSEKIDVSKNLIKLTDIPTYATSHLLENLVILYFSSLNKQKDPKKVTNLILVFSKNVVMTIRNKELEIIEKAKKHLHKNKPDTPGYVIFSILDEIITEYFDYLELVEDHTATLEEQIMENPSQDLLKEIFSSKARLIIFNKILWYERGILFSLKHSELPFINNKLRNLFDDLHDDLTKQIDIVETFREILSDAIDAYLSTISNRINFSLKSLTIVILYLTIITTVTSFPNTIATIFGIPVFGQNTDWKIILFLLIVSTVIPLFWLAKKRWIKFQ